MKGGWYLTTAPTITAKWEADDSGDKWTVPFGGGVGRAPVIILITLKPQTADQI